MGIVSYTARDPEGAPVRSRIAAATLEEAHAALTRRGLTEIEFLSAGAVPDLDGLAAREAPLPPRRSRWMTMLQSTVLHFGAFGFVAAAFCRSRHATVLVGILAAFALLSWPLVVLPPIVRARLDDAKALAQWERVARLLAFLRFAKAMTFTSGTQTLGWFYDLQEATLLAATARFDAAVELLRKYAGTTPETRARHHAAMVNLCLYANHREDARTHARAAAELMPGTGDHQLEVALRELECGDVEAARAALERAGALLKSRVARTFEHLVLGRILIAEHAFSEAADELRAARAAIGAETHVPAGFRATCDLWIAVAVAETNDPDGATALLERSMPFMRHPYDAANVARARDAIARARARTPYRGAASGAS